MLKITNFSKTYDGVNYAVKDLNLEVKPGQIVAFIGHNGAGKTTTLKAIVSILPFEKGKILVNNMDVSVNELETKKIIAYIPDTPDLYEHLKGNEFLNFIADAYLVSEEKRKHYITKYATLFKIDKNLHQPISSYSHGMKQKLAIVAALLHEPKLLLLDEPFVGLDPKSSHDFKEIMKELIKNGVAIVYSTHVLEVAEKLATHVAIIKNGELVKYGEISYVLKDTTLEKFFLELADEKH